jgi:hypothetical protein
MLPPMAMGFAERVGGVLVAPRRTLARLAAGEQRAGDVAWLVIGWLVAAYLPQLVHAGLVARALGADNGLQALLVTVSQLLPDVLGIFAAGMVMSLFLPKAARAAGLDLAGYAWVPYLLVQLVGSLVFTALGTVPSPLVRKAVTAVGLVWGLVIWGLALAAARTDAPVDPAAPAAPADHVGPAA